MATYQELRARSQQVRDEQNIGGNTALRVGQLLMDIVKYFNDNDAAASEYLQQHFAMVNDGTQLLNWQQSPIVILHTMGETYDEGDFSSLSQGENYYHAGFIMEANGQGGGINGETPKTNVLYVNLANDTLYTWNGASFDAITSGGGGSISGDDIIKNAYYSNGNLVLVVETEGGDKTVSIPVNFDASNYVPTSRTVNGKALSNNITLSQSDIPGLVAALAAKVGYSDDEWLQVKAGAMQAATAVPNTTTVNGKQLNDNIVIGMADIPGLLQAIANAGSGAVSVIQPDPADGTFIIQVGSTDYTINLNHTHEGMAKLVKCTEATLPQTMADDTIYVQVDNLTTPTEIEALHIFGLEFTGGGLPAGTPAITKPSGTSINLGENSGSGVSKAIEIKANSHITGDLTVGLAANSNLSFDTTNLPSGVTYNSGAGTLTIAQATAMQGVNITIVYSGSGAAEIDGGLVISGGGVTPKSVVVEVVAVQLLAFWDGADVPSNGKWIDKINSLPINLFGTASHATNGYQLNNISDQDAAYALSDAANNVFLNQEIDKEFRAIVECSIKFGATSRRALVLDFAAFAETQSGLSANAFILQSGEMRSTFKKNGNNIIDGSAVVAQTDITFPVGTYVDVTIEIGARILQSGKQELYVRAGNAINSKTIDTPVAVSFAGARENSGAFALGIGYFAGNNNTLNAYASDVFADVIYKSIKIYKN